MSKLRVLAASLVLAGPGSPLEAAAATIPDQRFQPVDFVVIDTHGRQVCKAPGVHLGSGNSTRSGYGTPQNGGSPAPSITPAFNSAALSTATFSLMGLGWRSEADQTLALGGSGRVTWTDAWGQTALFVPKVPATLPPLNPFQWLKPASAPTLAPLGPPVYASPVNTYETLTYSTGTPRNVPTALLLAAKDGTKTLFQTFESTAVLRPALLTDRDGNTLTYARDALGRLTRITDVHGRYTAFSYNAQGFLATMTDQTGRTVTYLYDANGRKTSETGPEGTTSYGYDALNRLTSVTFPNSGVKRYGYDASGRVAHEDQDGKEGLDYVYGSSVTTVTDAVGRKTTHAFMARSGLRVETLLTDNAGKQISFDYDRNLNLTLQDDKRLGTDRNTRYGYDAFGNVTALTDPMGGVTNTTYENVFNQPTLIIRLLPIDRSQ